MTEGSPLIVEDLDLSGFGFYLTKEPGVPEDDYYDSGFTSFGRKLWARKSDEGTKRHTYLELRRIQNKKEIN